MDTWDEFFQQGVSAPSSEAEGAPQGYVLKPIDGQLIYLRRGPNVRQEESQAVQEADVHLNTVSLHLSSELALQPLFRLFRADSPRRLSLPIVSHLGHVSSQQRRLIASLLHVKHNPRTGV